jgi:uncharacterized protein YecE (DUF72 family)
MNDLNQFLSGLERLQNEISHILTRIPPITEETPATRAPEVDQVIGALEEVGEIERYLQNRRSTESGFVIDSEADVQDLSYTILRPWVHDLVDESPGEKVASRYTIKDFRSKALRIIVEAKYINNKAHGKSVVEELHDDIEMYANEEDYDYVVFFVYDPGRHIRDVRALKRQIEKLRHFDGRLLTCRLIVRPV